MQEAYVLIRHKESSSMDTLAQRAVTRFKTVVEPNCSSVVRIYVVKTKRATQAIEHRYKNEWMITEFRLIYTV